MKRYIGRSLEGSQVQDLLSHGVGVHHLPGHGAFTNSEVLKSHSALSNPGPAGHMQPRMVMNAAQHKIRNLLKTFFFCSSVFVSVCVFNVWPKTTLLPVWPKRRQKLDTPCRGCDGGYIK